ncbi:hypothetical protein LTR99_011046 [Exophiala xenobiotica]|uniref:Uncharacterized protein n=1 Tax=Vermiconidia calcicola TaxID=1690605 RepID=A0AAV9PUZ2_9PEZI|nr:hypothetical protein LTR99_011046 [Exophiala xenobiotica]KAK5400746.1 hypothetical protein LTR06_011297 [Exophiala xenobiotica]KAK5425458.1 hypothetical protein LTR34_011089 [Exophiala xenobiotica]KAK5527647.1 hypothetical protein LTR25_011011 [Vermiconidia calcicola]KAK5529013.1 hypothetical protein LTR23_010865 [Chaetothyriales sp. CCFEE 6169]
MENLNMRSSTYTPPLALTVFSWISVGIAVLASLWLTFDIVYRRGWRSMMAIMIPVYIINALYLWPITVWTYIKYGRPEVPGKDNKIEDPAEEGEQDPLCTRTVGSITTKGLQAAHGAWAKLGRLQILMLVITVLRRREATAMARSMMEEPTSTTA